MAKSNKEYWADRAKRREAEAKEMGEELTKEILAEYEKAVRDINEKISSFYVRYADKYGLTAEQAMKKMNLAEFKQWKKSLEEYVKEIEKETDLMKSKELKARLDALSYNSQISRLDALKEQIGMSANTLAAKNQNIMTEGFKNIFEASMAKKAYDLSERGLKPDIKFREKIFDENLVKEVMSYPWSGADYSERLWKNTNSLAFTLKQELAQGMIKGTALPQMAKSISEKTGQSFKTSERLVETETSRIHGESNFKVYEAAGIEAYEFIAEKELTTCSVCAGLDGKHFNVKDRQVGENAEPMHPHCHCTTIEYDPDEELDYINSGLEYEKRKTWQEWWEEQKKLHGEEKMNAEVKKVDNRASDQKQYEKYSIIFKNGFPKTFEEFQELKYNKIREWNKFKNNKQEKLNSLDYSQIKDLKYSLGNKEVRSWYKAHDEKILELVDKTSSLEQQAKQAFNLRNNYRSQARELMADQKERERLDKERPNKSFEELLEYKKLKYGLEGEAAYKDILRSSETTNKEYDKKAGLEG